MARRQAKATSSDDDADDDHPASPRAAPAKRSRKKVVYDEDDQADGDGDFAGEDVEESHKQSVKASITAAKSVDVSPPLPSFKTKNGTIISTPPRPSRTSGGSVPDTVMRKRLSVINKPSTLSSINTAMVPADGAPPPQRVSREVMNNNFEEWMKLATDNKITATNTWNFALIDYFADLTLLRNGPDDESINFQKASCTLDGCVKIWTSRVDSVANETGKLLSGLSSSGGRDGDEEGDQDDPDAEEDAARREKRKATRSEATLAKSFSTLQVKKFDLEFTVDPLFKKTCADFDEGGAMGLLMNHLGVDGKGRVVFDAGDVEEEEEEEEEIDEEDEEDLDLDKLQEFIPSSDELANRNVSVTLSDFKFSSDPSEAFSLSVLGLSNEKEESGIGGDALAEGSGGVHDFFGDDDAGGGGADFGGDFGGPVDRNDEDGEADLDVEGGNIGGVLGPEHAPLDPRRVGDGKQMFVGMSGDDEGDGMMLDYFDQGFLKNWAGPEHWKLRKVTRKPDPTALGATRQARKERAPFLIDFESPSTISFKEMFAAGPRPSIKAGSRVSTAGSDPRRRVRGKSSGSKKEEKRDEHLLPDDMHFSSRQLLRLFMKPKFTMKMRKQGAAAAQLRNNDRDIDENFWAQAAAERAEIDAGAEDEAGLPIAPFESQFFHDDIDDGIDFAEVDDGLVVTGEDGGEADDLWAGTQGQQLRKAKPESVHYAKKAKRVDVKRLKDNIWRGLDMSLDAGSTSETESEASIPTVKDDPLGQPRTFDSVIQNLRQSYPAEKMSEISTSFCFICLLHLANEEGLKIEPARLDDGEEEEYAGEAEVESAGWGGKFKGTEIDERADRLVGELQALKIWRDPTAGKAA